MNLNEVKIEFDKESEEFDEPFTSVDGFPIQDDNEYLIILNDGTSYFTKSNLKGSSLHSPDGRTDLTSKIKWIGIYKAYEIF